MELYQLRTFIAVARERSITRAAKRLFTTPPAISAQIKALEDELNVELFTRTPKGMQITGKGELLRLKAEQTLQAAQDLVNHAGELQSYLIGRVSLGLNATTTFLCIAQLTHHLQQHCPGIELSLQHSASGNIIRQLRDNTLDAGFVFGPLNDPALHLHYLTTAELVIAAPSAWQQQLDRAGWADIAGLPWIYSHDYCPFQEITDRLFDSRGLSCRRALQSSDEADKAELIGAGVGLALLEKSEAERAAAAGQLVIWPGEQPITCTLSIACRQQRAADPLVKAVCESVQQIWLSDL